MTAQADLCICICTFRRPDGLRDCLRSLTVASVEGVSRYEVLVVDNDAAGSAQAIVESLRPKFRVPLHYEVEPRSGVSFARNRCIAKAQADLIAFIDDDECASDAWLAQLVRTFREHSADAVLGPVLARPAANVPRWVLESGALDRPRYATGTTVHWGNGRTGNVLLDRNKVLACGGFDPAFAGSGGEDVRLFLELHKRFNAKVVWCDEAVVFETVPAERLSVKYLLSRALQGGRISVRAQAAGNGRGEYLYWFLRGLVGLPVRSILAALSVPASRAMALRYARRAAGDLGKMLAIMPSRARRYGTGV